MPHWIRFRPFILSACVPLFLLAGLAHADDDLGGDGIDDMTEWGFGARVRHQRISKRLQKIFLADTPGPITQEGAGVELTRRRQDQLELVLGFGYDNLNGNDGYYLEAGGDPTTSGDVDFVEFRDLHWFTVEGTIIGNAELHKLLTLRYGVGLGVGLVRGEVRKSDAVCSSDDLQNDCEVDPEGEESDEPADVPPVLPVVNALVGLQLRPVDFLGINVDAGLHSVPYISGGVTLYLW